MTDQPLVSVIMTAYNAERFIEQTINSITNQTLNNFEFVIVDDGSDDATPEILKKAASDPRIKIISRQRIGRGKALNVAWKNTSGQYIANIDADDIAQPERLEIQSNYLSSHPDIGLLGSACSILDEDTSESRILDRPLHDHELKRTLIKYNPFVHSSVMMPRHVLESVGGYNENIPVTIDYDLWVRIARSCIVANLPDVLTIKRVSKTAYFRNRIPTWVRYKCHIFIRWNAWKNHPESLADLRYVITSIGRYLYARAHAILTRHQVRRGR